MSVDRFVEYTKKPNAAFGERTFWRCKVCGASGTDEPAVKRTAADMADAHFEKAMLHFSACRLMPTTEDKRSDLYRWLLEEMSIYGQMGAADAAAIATDIARAYYDAELRELKAKLSREVATAGSVGSTPRVVAQD